MHVTTTLLFSLPQFSSWYFQLLWSQSSIFQAERICGSLTVLLRIALSCRFQLYSRVCHEEGNKEICQSAMKIA